MVIYLADEALRPRVASQYRARGTGRRPMSERDEAQCGALPRLSRRHFVIGGAMLATSAMAYARKPKRTGPWWTRKFSRAGLEKIRELVTGRHSGVVLPPPDSLSDRLYDNLVTPVYASGDTFVMTLIAYNNRQDGVLQVTGRKCVSGRRLRAHRYAAASGACPGTPGAPPAFLQLRAPTGSSRSSSTRFGDAYPRTWAEQRLAVVGEILRGGVPMGSSCGLPCCPIGEMNRSRRCAASLANSPMLRLHHCRSFSSPDATEAREYHRDEKAGVCRCGLSYEHRALGGLRKGGDRNRLLRWSMARRSHIFREVVMPRNWARCRFRKEFIQEAGPAGGLAEDRRTRSPLAQAARKDGLDKVT